MKQAIIVTLRGRMQGWIDAIGGQFATYLGTGGEGFNDPLSLGMRAAGVVMANPLMPTDTEIDGIPVASLDLVLDIAEHRLLVNAHQNYVDVDFTVGPRSEHADQLRRGLQTAIANKAEQIARAHGANALGGASGGSSSLGVIGLTFQERGW